MVASHGDLSNAILRSAALIAGDKGLQDYVHIEVDLNDSREKIRKMVDDAITAWQPDDEILVLTDIIGGNVTNILSEYISTHNIHIITGMNLGMVLETLFADESTPIDELIETVLTMGKKGIRYLNEQIEKAGDAEV